jgi:hypothetical protein
MDASGLELIRATVQNAAPDPRYYVRMEPFSLGEIDDTYIRSRYLSIAVGFMPSVVLNALSAEGLLAPREGIGNVDLDTSRPLLREIQAPEIQSPDARNLGYFVLNFEDLTEKQTI